MAARADVHLGARRRASIVCVEASVTPVILWGARGHAKVVREALHGTGHEVVALFDNDPQCPAPFSDVPLGHGWEAFRSWQASAHYAQPCVAVVCIGGDRGLERIRLQRSLSECGVAPFTLVHRRAFVATNAVLGPGCQVLALAAVCADAVLEEGCIINTAASVDHDCRLEAGVHLAPGARLAGCVRAGRYATIYTGAVVLPHVVIGEGAVVGAGAVVTEDVPAYTLVAGMPARPMRTLAKSPS
jgi:sugar O-acyltransferase (sialic acid O-acetyltransferase NeuD family)